MSLGPPGRPRRCGWLDLPQLRYAVDVNATQLCMRRRTCSDASTKSKLTAARIAVKIDHLPFGIRPDEVEPVHHPAWLARRLDGHPLAGRGAATLLDYVAFIEEAVGVPVIVLSVGLDRADLDAQDGPDRGMIYWFTGQPGHGKPIGQGHARVFEDPRDRSLSCGWRRLADLDHQHRLLDAVERTFAGHNFSRITSNLKHSRKPGRALSRHSRRIEGIR